MRDRLLNMDEKYLSQEAINLLGRIKKKYSEIKLSQYVNWCIIKAIDVRVSSEIIIKHLNTIEKADGYSNTITTELLNNLKNITNKRSITRREENKAYEIMSDIAFIIESSYTSKQRNITIRKGLKNILFNMLRWIKNIF
ncbi:hypothetical protein J2Z44_003938 [Clostridium punense]|uniref:Uncharacterized protein n=1 Tax=Clostridium punense TaxID=1054297 RepID=A0ABS4K8I3_9CLOT|nr:MULTISPECIES: hypothetical protein [Clostridium]EQB89218.1 hypothetical protein M918_21315 [Clostridium sp. BL8]MBP2024088.1 hypothetical protein [Clostridium punense]